MNTIELPDAIEPLEWFVVFHRQAPTRLLSLLAFGEFKHVSAFAYVPGFKAWLVYDAQLAGTRLFLLPHRDTSKAVLIRFMDNCAVLKIAKQWNSHAMPWSSRLGFYCVPAVIHLLGLRCVAVRPDALYRHILRNGGIRVDEFRQHVQRPGIAARSELGDRAAAGAN
jgi:hypothetical protein